ncbi:MAG TPA: flippase [Patescibacteria group bacterium]|nr:flippase [Patescibacteria group bacterium]
MNKSLAHNTAIFTIALGVQKVFSFLFFWYLSSKLGPHGLGQYAFALSFTALFSVFTDIGMSTVLTREIAKDQKSASHILGTAFSIKIISAIIVLVVMAIIVLNSDYDPLVRSLIALASLVMVSDSLQLLFSSFFRGMHTLAYESVSVLVFQVIEIVVGVIALEVTGDVRWAIVSVAIASVSVLVYFVVSAWMKFRCMIVPVWDKHVMADFLKLLPSFAIATIIVRVYNTADVILIERFIGAEAVGMYSVPAKVITAFQGLFAGSFAAALYPLLASTYHTNKKEVSALLAKAFHYMSAIAFPMALGLGGTAGLIIATIWPEYHDAVIPFVLMAVSLPFIFLSFPTGALLNASDRQRMTTINRLIGTVLNIGLNILFIPYYGITAAAGIFLCTNILIFALDCWCVRKELDYVKQWVITKGIRIIASGAIMSGVVWQAQEMHASLVWVMVAGIVAYLLCVWFMRAITRDDIMIFISEFRKKDHVAPDASNTVL